MRAISAETEPDRSLDECELIRQARTDRAAFEPLYWRYRDRVFRYLRTRTPQEADAADLTQHVFLRALNQLPQYDERRGTVAAWLFGIARHSATDFHRQRRRLRHAEDGLEAVLAVAAGEMVEAEIIRRDELRHLARAL